MAHDFAFDGITFTPKVFAGYGQIMSHNVTKDEQDFQVSTDASSMFVGAGFGVSYAFKMADTPVQAFGSFESSCDASERNTYVQGQKYAVSHSNQTLSLGLKANLSKESNLFATTRVNVDKADVAQGFEFGFNLKI